MKMRSRFDLRDWSIRRGMLLTAILLSVTAAAAICLPLAALLSLGLLVLLLLLLPCMRRVTPLFCVVIILIGLCRGAMYRFRTIEPVAQLIGKQDTIQGIVEECPSSGHMYVVRVTQADRIPINSRILLYCSDQVAPSLNDFVSSTVEFKELYRTQKYHRADGVFLQAYPTTYDEKSVISYPSDSTSWRTALRPVREKLSYALFDMLNAEEGGLLVGVCLGDRSRVDDHVADIFRTSGLSHLLSVSGLHMSVIAGGMILLMRMLKVHRTVGNTVTAMVILLFMWIVEFTPSVTRAGIMYLVLIVGQLSRYRSDSLNSLGFALSLILLVSPAAILDIGMWLSFVATVGILCLTPRINSALCTPLDNLPSLFRVPARWLIGSVSISIGCTLPIMPLLLLTFGEISLVSPIANLFAVMPAGWMTILGCLGALVSIVPGVGFIGKGLVVIAGLLAKWLIVVSEWCSCIPGALLRPTDAWVIMLLAGGGILLSVAIMRFSFRRVCALLCTLLCALFVVLPINCRLNMNTVTVSIGADKYGSVVVAEHDAKGVVIVNDAASIYTASSMLDDLRVSQPQLLVVANCRTQHEAILAEWRREYPLLKIVSATDISRPQLVDHTITVSDNVEFWDGCALSVTSDAAWILSVGDTRLLIALSSESQISSPVPSSQVVLLYEGALLESLTLEADAVFCVDDPASSASLETTDGICLIEDEESVLLVTNGDGRWRRLWRALYVLE